MSKEMLNQEEKNRLGTIYDRIETALKRKGFKTVSEMNDAIKRKRGKAPDKSLFSKLQCPPRLKQEYYNMTIDNLLVIADELDVSTDYLLGLSENISRNDDKKINSLGLSDESLDILINIRKKARTYPCEKIKSTSRYYVNPYYKVLRMLNWIIQHINVSDEINERDFLSNLYNAVMLRFDKKSATANALVNSLIRSTFKEQKKYEELLNSFQHTYIEEGDKQMMRSELAKARLAYLKKKKENEENRKVLQELLEGVVSVGDPVSFDQTKVKLADPYDSFFNDMRIIIDDWRNEYSGIYERKRKAQDDEYAEWARNKANELFDGPRDEGVDETVPEPSYIPPYLRNMSVSEQKEYLLALYAEENGLGNMSIDSNGQATIPKMDSDIIKQIKIAEEDKTGLYLAENGKVMYSEDRATDPNEWCRELFERYNLPTMLEDWMNNLGNLSYNISFFDEEKYYEYRSKEDADKIIAKAKKKGAVITVGEDQTEIRKNS